MKDKQNTLKESFIVPILALNYHFMWAINFEADFATSFIALKCELFYLLKVHWVNSQQIIIYWEIVVKIWSAFELFQV